MNKTKLSLVKVKQLKFINFILILVMFLSCKYQKGDLQKILDIKIYRTQDKNTINVSIKNLSKKDITRIIMEFQPSDQGSNDYIEIKEINHIDNINKKDSYSFYIPIKPIYKLYLSKNIKVNFLVTYKNSTKLHEIRIVPILPR